MRSEPLNVVVCNELMSVMGGRAATTSAVPAALHEATLRGSWKKRALTRLIEEANDADLYAPIREVDKHKKQMDVSTNTRGALNDNRMRLRCWQDGRA